MHLNYIYRSDLQDVLAVADASMWFAGKEMVVGKLIILRIA